jgi:hypothetical protein
LPARGRAIQRVASPALPQAMTVFLPVCFSAPVPYRSSIKQLAKMSSIIVLRVVLGKSADPNPHLKPCRLCIGRREGS